jgi:hypothetical protein
LALPRTLLEEPLGERKLPIEPNELKDREFEDRPLEDETFVEDME